MRAFLIAVVLLASGPAQAQSDRIEEPAHKPIDVRRLEPCNKYRIVSAYLIGMQARGISYSDAADWAASQAYGPNGEVLRDSESNADALMALAAAVYFARDKYGSDMQTFAQHAFDGCMEGKLLDASH